MKISQNVLRQIIKEELENILKLVSDFADLDKFKKEKTYHDDEECDDEFSEETEDFHTGMGGGDSGKRKHPTDYLKGGANEKNTTDNIMLGGSAKGEFDDGEGANIIIRWQQLAESKRR